MSVRNLEILKNQNESHRGLVSKKNEAHGDQLLKTKSRNWESEIWGDILKYQGSIIQMGNSRQDVIRQNLIKLFEKKTNIPRA